MTDQEKIEFLKKENSKLQFYKDYVESLKNEGLSTNRAVTSLVKSEKNFRRERFEYFEKLLLVNDFFIKNIPEGEKIFNQIMASWPIYDEQESEQLYEKYSGNI